MPLLVWLHAWTPPRPWVGPTMLPCPRQRRHGFFYNWNEKFHPMHQYKMQKLFFMEGPCPEEGVQQEKCIGGGWEWSTWDFSGNILLHYSQAPMSQTMQDPGLSNCWPTITLINSCSNHNFMDPTMVERKRIHAQDEDQYKVIVAYRDWLKVSVWTWPSLSKGSLSLLIFPLRFGWLQYYFGSPLASCGISPRCGCISLKMEGNIIKSLVILSVGGYWKY